MSGFKGIKTTRPARFPQEILRSKILTWGKFSSGSPIDYSVLVGLRIKKLKSISCEQENEYLRISNREPSVATI